MKASDPQKAVESFERLATACPAQAPKALQRIGEVQEARGERAAAAAAYDRLDREFPLSVAAHDTAPRLACSRSPFAGRLTRRKGSARPRQRTGPRRGRPEHRRGPGFPHHPGGRALRRRSRPGPRAPGPGARLARTAARGRDRPLARQGDVAARCRGRLPAREDQVAPGVHGGLRAGRARATPARPGPRMRCSPSRTTTRRTRATTRRCPTGGACSPSTRTASTSSGPPGASAWVDYRAGRYEAAAQALERTARLRPPSAGHSGLPLLGRTLARRAGPDGPRAAAPRRDGPALQVRVPRPARPRRARAAAGCPGGRADRRSWSPPRRSGPSRRVPEPQAHARPPAPADRPARRGPGRAPGAALLAPGPGHHRLDRLAPRAACGRPSSP